jgi:hypothetical protein
MENNVNYDCCVPCFGKSIVDAKDIYTDHLMNILTPLIYEGLNSLYMQSKEYEKQAIGREKKDRDFKNPGANHFFQIMMSSLREMNDTSIEEETKRIKNICGCAEYFDDLIKAVIKSHISVLTCTVKEPKLLKENKFHQSVNINTFIHKCYIESIKFIFEMPEIFGAGKKSQQTIIYYIKLGIKDAIKQTLPMRQILEEFLNNNYESVYESHMEKIKNILIENIKKEKMESSKVNMLEESDVKGNDDKDNFDFDLDEFIVKKKNIEKTEIKPEIKSEIKSEVKQEIKPEVKSEVKQEVKSEVKQEVKSEVKQEVKSEVKQEAKSEKNEIFEKKKNIDINAIFDIAKGKRANDHEMMFDMMEKQQNKIKVSEKNSPKPNQELEEKKEDNNISKDIIIDRKIKDSDNKFYEN